MHTVSNRSVNPNISGDSLAPCIWRAVFLCSCSVMNCADSDHFCCWFSGLRFVYQIMSQWFIIIIRVVIKSSPAESWKSSQVSSHWISSPSQVESFSLFNQASHKSLNLRLESSHVTRVPHLWYFVHRRHELCVLYHWRDPIWCSTSAAHSELLPAGPCSQCFSLLCSWFQNNQTGFPFNPK